MNKLKNPASRAVYRKAILQKSQPYYYQKLLTSQDNPNSTQHLQKQLDTHILMQNPQLISNHLEQHDLTLTDADEDNSNNHALYAYYDLFVSKNERMRSRQRVEIEQINIEYDNYKAIMKECTANIYNLTHTLLTQVKQLQNKYAEYRRILTCKSTTPSAQAKSIKNAQTILEQQISTLQSKLEHQLQCRNAFIYRLLQEGYYQTNGLVWMLEEIIRIRDQDRESAELLDGVCAGSDVKNVYHKPNIELQLKQQYLPTVLDSKSKHYLTQVYNQLQQQKHTEQTKSRQLRTRISRRQQSQQKQPKPIYILDMESSIFPKSNTINSPNHPQRYQPDNNTYMIAKTHDNILMKSKLSDLARSMEVHTRTQKYNYDIKCIYANTRQSLLKWVKGKCKQVVDEQLQGQNNSSLIQQQQDKNSPSRIQNNSLMSRKNANTQDSMFVFTKPKYSQVAQTKIGSYVNSPIANNLTKPKRKTTSCEHRDVNEKGFSLPLISSKAEKRTPNLSKLENNITFIEKSRLDSADKGIGAASIDNQQKEQKIRILRIYPRQHQEIALKYLFGTQAKRQIVERLLFQ